MGLKFSIKVLEGTIVINDKSDENNSIFSRTLLGNCMTVTVYDSRSNPTNTNNDL